MQVDRTSEWFVPKFGPGHRHRAQAVASGRALPFAGYAGGQPAEEASPGPLRAPPDDGAVRHPRSARGPLSGRPGAVHVPRPGPHRARSARRPAQAAPARGRGYRGVAPGPAGPAPAAAGGTGGDRGRGSGGVMRDFKNPAEIPCLVFFPDLENLPG